MANQNLGTITYEVDVKTSKAVEATKSVTEVLDEIVGVSGKAEKGTRTLSEQVGRLSNQFKGSRKFTEEQAQALTKLMDRINPTEAKIRNLNVAQDQLALAFKRSQLTQTEFANASKKLQDELDKLEGKTKKTSAGMEAFKGILTPLAAAFGAMKIASLAKEYTMLAEEMSVTRVQIDRLSGSVALGEQNFQALIAVANSVGVSFADTNKVWSALSVTMADMGKSGDEILVLTDNLLKMGAVGGASAEQTASAIVTLNKAMLNGEVSGRQFMQIMTASPEIGRQISLGLGVPLQEVMSLLESGQLDAEDLMDILLGRTKQINEEFGKLPRMVGEAGAALSNSMGAAVVKLNDAIKATQTLAFLMDKISRGINLSTGNLSDQEKLNQLLQERANLQGATARADAILLGGGRLKIVNDEKILEINKQILDIQNRRIEQQKKDSAAANKKAQEDADPNRSTKDGSKAIADAQKRIDLLKLSGVEQAKERARQALGAKASEGEVAQAMKLAEQEYNLTQEIADKKKTLREQEAEAKKQLAKDQAALLKSAAEEKRHIEENSKAITDYAVSIGLAAMSGEDLARAQAQSKLNKFATEDDVRVMDDLAKAMYKVQQADKEKAMLASVDSKAGASMAYQQQLKDLQTLRDAEGQYKLEEQDYLLLKEQAEVDYNARMTEIEAQRWAAQSAGNEAMLAGFEALASSGGQALAGLLSGTTSLKDAMGSVANTVLNAVIGSFVQMGVDWVKQQVFMQGATQATKAAEIGGIAAVATAQNTATGTIAATTTTAAATTGTAVAGSMAPAAGLSSIASFGGAAVIGGAALLATMALAKSSGGRQYGGGVQAGSMYRVNETGAPEIFNAANGRQYMMPNSRGEVVSNKDATAGSGSGGSAIVNIHNYTGAQVSQSQSTVDRQQVIDIVIGDMMQDGKIARATNQITGTRRQGV